MDHSHHQCVHRALKFCGRCNAVWCQACKNEWRQTTFFSPSSWSYRMIPGQIYCGTSGGTGVNSGSADLATLTTPAVCTHDAN